MEKLAARYITQYITYNKSKWNSTKKILFFLFFRWRKALTSTINEKDDIEFWESWTSKSAKSQQSTKSSPVTTAILTASQLW